VTLAELNACDRSAFVQTVGWTFEHSPWVAERAWSGRPFASLDALHTAMTDIVAAADRAEQMALLRAHPDLGTRARMSDASAGEQAGAGLDQLTSAAYADLQRLNQAYRDRFGFPFLLAVKGRTTAEVLLSLAVRVEADHAIEFLEALRQVGRIARFRLEDVFHE
jgi:OHCU decarboxylase